VRRFKTKPFTRFADKAGISDAALCRAVGDADRGLVAAGLGGGVIKTADRAPWPGKIRRISNADCIQGGQTGDLRPRFAKSEKDNIERDELAALKKLAAELLAYDEKMIARAVASGVLLEVNCDEKTVP
jgi:hypothetical protein